MEEKRHIGRAVIQQIESKTYKINNNNNNL